MVEVFIKQGATYVWDLKPRRRLTEVEIGEYASLLGLIENLELSQDIDIRKWLDGSSSFSAKFVCRLLMDVRRMDNQLGCVDFPVDRVWKSNLVPPKVAFFVWTLLRGRILTIDNHKGKGLQIVNRCCYCKGEEETVHHLFSACPEVRKIWNWFWIDADSNKLLGHNLKERLLQTGGIWLSRIGGIYFFLPLFGLCGLKEIEEFSRGTRETSCRFYVIS